MTDPVVPPRERAMLDAEEARLRNLIALFPSTDIVVDEDNIEEVEGRIVVAKMIVAEMKVSIVRMQAILDAVVKAAK